MLTRLARPTDDTLSERIGSGGDKRFSKDAMA